MASMLPPPRPAAFALRVQLYAPTSTDRPVRSFRVVTSPDATVHEFCVAASRTCLEAYGGEPISIKKCQDDKGFDISQGDVIGDLFNNAEIIRLVQAPTNHRGVRDSVPPTSALRFNPTNHTGRKRGREGSELSNGSALTNSLPANKRQRVTGLDPDKPIASREDDMDVQRTIYEEVEPHNGLVPNSQQDPSYGDLNASSRYIRDDVPRVSETPSPPPAVPVYRRNHSADPRTSKLNGSKSDEDIRSQSRLASPIRSASVRAEEGARSLSASFQRGTPVAVKAMSTLFGAQQAPTTNVAGSSNKRKTTTLGVESPKVNGKSQSRSNNEDSIYDVPSDSESSARSRRTQSKANRPSPSGLPGNDWANNRAKKLNTPPTEIRRTSRSQEHAASNGELALTPNSKTREERRLRELAEEARRSTAAAAQAAEQRKRDAEEARAAERAIKATAARLEQERMQKVKDVEEREAEERRVERERKLKEKQDAELLEAEENARAVREKQEAERLVKERKARVARERREAEKLERAKQAKIQEEQQEAARVVGEKAKADEAKRLAEEEAKKSLTADEARKSRELSAQSKDSSTLNRPKETPIRAPSSSTRFIPLGRKSALKGSSSQAVSSPSPELVRKGSIASSNGSKNELDVPNSAKRRVSFNIEESRIYAPIVPPARKKSIKSSAPTVAPQKQVSPAARRVSTPVPPPSKRSSKESSSTPILPPQPNLAINPAVVKSAMVKPAVVKPAVGKPAATKPAVATPPPAKKPSPSYRAVLSKPSGSISESSASTTSSKQPAKLTPPPAAQAAPPDDEEEGEEDDKSGEEDDDDDDSENLDGSSRMTPMKALNSSLQTSIEAKSVPKQSFPAPEPVEDDDGDLEMRDAQRSSSRSPVVFNSHTTPAKPESTLPVEDISSSGESSDEEESVDGEAVSVDENGGEEDEKTVQVTAPRSPSLSLPKTPSVGRPIHRKKLTSPGSSRNFATTQDEVDFQLTSSVFEASSAALKSTPVPAPSSSNVVVPKSSFGASLSSLAKKPFVGMSAKINGKAPLKLVVNQEESESESDDESESSDSDSDDEKEQPQSLQTPKQTTRSTKDSDDSDSDSDSDGSDKENEGYLEELQKELVEKITADLKSDSQRSTQSFDGSSPKVGKASQSSKSSEESKGKKDSKSGNKYLSNYQFSQPK